MITYDRGHERFNVRIAGVAVHNGRVLLHRFPRYQFWALPGGRAEMREPSRDGLVREMREELGVEVTAGRLIWIVENFFHHEEKDYHEIAFYYEMTLPPNCKFLTQETFHGIEGTEQLTFQWFPVGALEKVTVYPRFLTKALKAMPETTQHLLEIDPVPA